MRDVYKRQDLCSECAKKMGYTNIFGNFEDEFSGLLGSFFGNSLPARTPVSYTHLDVYKRQEHIDSFTDYDFAHLLFSDGTVENAISLDNQLNIIQVADLVDVYKRQIYSTSSKIY